MRVLFNQWLVLILNSNRTYPGQDAFSLDAVQVISAVGILGILEWIAWVMVD